MAYTAADLAAFDAEIDAIRTAAATTSGDQSTTFRRLDEMLAFRAMMAASITTAAGQTRTRYAATSKGV